MQFLFFLLVYPLLWLISILPFPILYLLSDGVYVIVYHVVGYRKKTVRQNIAIAFPNLSTAERLEIEKKSYHHLCDMFLEMAKTMTISRNEIDKRFVFTNMQTYLDLEKKGKSIALLMAHYASYEWSVSINYHSDFQGFAIYKKLSNKYLDKLVRDIRSKFKAELISTKETRTVIEQNKINNILGLYGFISDQTPRKSSALHWYKFLGVETPIHVGAEDLAKKYDMNVVYLKVRKVKRGYYEATLEVLSEDVLSVPNYEISEAFIRKVEQQIQDAPEFYLWTHKRWKHQKNN
jgi:KDO2-lipid IV(A) lauroyltransferase